MKLLNLSLVGICFLITHLLTVLTIWKMNFEGSWGGFFLFVIDFPISLIVLLPVGWNHWLFFGVVGSLWWYLIGMLLQRAVARRKRRRIRAG